MMTSESWPPQEYQDVLAALALEFLRNPERRREWGDFYPVVRSAPPVNVGNGEWLVASWPDVRAAMACPGAELTPLYPSTGVPEVNELMLGMLPYQSGARHRRLRSMVQPLFGSNSIGSIEHELSLAVDRMLDPGVFGPDGLDVDQTLGVWLPREISALLLDVAPEDRPEFDQWSSVLYRQMGVYDQSDAEGAAARVAYKALREYVGSRTRTLGGPRFGGIGTALLAAHAAGHLDDDDLLSYFALFLLTGLDTITYAVANSICFLGSSPEVFERLRGRPDLSEVAFAEALRLWGPIRLCVRHMQQPLALPAGTIPEGALVFILIHAANRDPSHLADPDDVRWDRGTGHTLAFGVGPHGCLGGAVGLMIGRVLFSWLATRCERLMVSPHLDDATFIPSLPILGISGVRLSAKPAR